jgi:hypothetical protein
MTMDVNTSRGGTNRKINRNLTWLAGPVVLMVGFTAWTMLPGPSVAESQPAPAHSPVPVIVSAQNASWFDPAITPTETMLVTPTGEAGPADTTAPAETAPVDGLKISSQSWRRGGLGSKALVTLTLRNRNEYAVRDIEISCAFARGDGRHLTDRKRTIHDTVNTRSRRTFARMLVGFVNIGANQAKCSLVTASRI